MQTTENTVISDIKVCGQGTLIPIFNGKHARYINLDNAASTPALIYVQEKVNEFLSWYSSVHRGAGFKSLLSTHTMEAGRNQLMEFVGADSEEDCVIFVKNTTEAINKLANRLELTKDDVVLTTLMEHHSNDLPWRSKARTLHVETLEDGTLDLFDLEQKIDRHKGRLRLVTVTGASNVTGIMPPIYDIAELAHAAGAQILVDCAQLAPHRKIVMGPTTSPRHLDFIALSGHKMYAPFGTGALIGSKRIFSKGVPDYTGGGTIEVVTRDKVYWTSPPHSDEAGSPNVVGVIALNASLYVLSSIGMEAVARHESELTAYALEKLNQLKGIQIFGSTKEVSLNDRLGVIAFSVAGVPHAKVASILSFEGGIGVRNGCFCAHPYVLRLLGISPEDVEIHISYVLNGDRSQLPGLVRVSIGIYNTLADIDVFTAMLEKIISGDYQDDYVVNPTTGEYMPSNFDTRLLEQYFHS
ncbi:class V aminotransferase [Microgenomates group bacterium RBG_16_45_19]|nr:MAG: class V aminotransferase [Microgenomates group bacterium RBG_16_45_19]